MDVLTNQGAYYAQILKRLIEFASQKGQILLSRFLLFRPCAKYFQTEITKKETINHIKSINEMTDAEFSRLSTEDRTKVMGSFKGRSGIPVAVLEMGLLDKSWKVRAAAIRSCKGSSHARAAEKNACKRIHISLDTVREWLSDRSSDAREAALLSCYGRQIPYDVIMKGLLDESYLVRENAMRLIYGDTAIPVAIIREWINKAQKPVSQYPQNRFTFFSPSTL